VLQDVPKAPASIDVVRASRDGHQYHEAWAARIVLELLPPKTTLSAVAIEGFSQDDVDGISSAAHEIADLVRYRGGHSVPSADRVETIQFKYSIASADKPMRAAEMAKTIRKFASADTDILSLTSAHAKPKGHYELITNRPIDQDAAIALAALRTGQDASAGAGEQLTQLRAAIGLEGHNLRSFAERLTLTGSGGSLAAAEHRNLQTLASWSGATDTLTETRLSNLRHLVRERAGSRGQGANLIARVDVLGALNVAHENDLYPVPAALPAIETPINRPVLQELVREIFAKPEALLVHAAGGVGKTALMQALEEALTLDHHVLLFDGFGAGMWRDPSDSRQLPRKALPHLANLLAADGLCDLLLPAEHVQESLGAFRTRLSAAVKALRAYKPEASIVFLLDAIDHCGMQATKTSSDSFAHLFLKSFNVRPIDGVRVVASCRTHRRPEAQADAGCREFEVPLFTYEESRRLVVARHPAATTNEITALHRRSGGNPRLLDNFLRRGPPFDQAEPGTQATSLDDLLREQIDIALNHASERGTPASEAMGLFAGLAMLPPPVPIDELAAALGLTASDVESFVSDLFPMIESTPTGLVFRDEPTETLVTEMIAKDFPARDGLIARLRTRQSQSIYAARALPAILTEVGAVDDLVKLAFDPLDRGDLSRVAHRAIRLARLQGAAIACADLGRVDGLTEVSIEAARVSGATERSDDYLWSHPDLTAISEDDEAIRRFRDDRRAWPGSRHAALGVLDVFSNDIKSAALESGRALTWFNWAIGERRRGRTVADGQDDNLITNALFVQLLFDKADNIEKWLARQDDAEAFSKASAILKLLSAYSCMAHDEPQTNAVMNVIAECRSTSPEVVAAVLSCLEIPAEPKRRLMAHLAALPSTPPKRDTYDDRGIQGALADGVIAAAGRAVGLGLSKQAKEILRHAPALRVSAHDYSDPWIADRGVGRHLKVAAIAAAARRRPTRLADILPDDMRGVVPASIHRRGPAAVEGYIRALIKKPSNQRRGRNERSIDYERTQRWEQALTHRLEPLVSFVNMTTEILRAADLAHAVKQAASAALQAIASAQSYPHRDQRRFLGQRILDLIRWAASCREPLDRETGDQIAELLEKTESPFVDEWIETVALLARQQATHAIALRLTKGAEALIDDETQVGERIKSYGALARVLLPISVAEARAYFRVGFELADSVGSDDHNRISDLVVFAARYDGSPLPPEIAHCFVRLCELNFPDDSEKFNWRAFTRALSRISGVSGIAQVARLADRRSVDLGWSLPPMLKVLVEQERLNPKLAAAIAGLAEFKATWNWFLPDMATAIMPRLSLGDRERFAKEVFVELDRANGGPPYPEELTKLKLLVEAELPLGSEARERVSLLHAEFSSQRKGDADTARTRISVLPVEMGSAATISPQNLRSALEQIAAGYENHRPHDEFLLRGLVESVVDPSPRSALLKAIVADDEFNLEEKVAALEEMADHWRGQSRALDAEIEHAAIKIGLSGLDSLVRTKETWQCPVSRLARVAGNRSIELITKLIGALAGQNHDVSSDFWMSCALALSKEASSKAIGSALSRYATLASATLPDSVGDGPWSQTFQVAEDSTAIIASLLWLRLGAPEASNRWRAAHALRRLIESGDKQILQQLMNRLDDQDAGPFQDRSLPFFHMNAKLWLLIAVARIAKGMPAAILPFRTQLEAIAQSKTFPHALCRHFAVETLKCLVDQAELDDRRAYQAWLGALNRPRGQRVTASVNAEFYSKRPTERPEPEPPFWFDYDFDRYVVEPLCRVFGLPRWEAHDAIIAWVRRFDTSIKSMADSPRRKWREESREWGSAATPEVHSHGGQLGWHGVMLAAGQFVNDCPVSGYSWEDAPWEDWLSSKALSRPDGMWLADGIDMFPVKDRRLMPERIDGAEEAHVPPHPLDLLKLGGFDDSLAIPTQCVVDGRWESADGLSVSISSQLVPIKQARLTAHVVYSAKPFFAHLSSDDGDDDLDRRHSDEKELLTPWLSSDTHSYALLDEDDPYGLEKALHRSQPSARTIAKMGLQSADPFCRTWVSNDGRPIFCAEAWGTLRGNGRHRTVRGGTKLIVDRDGLMSLLETDRQALILLIKVQKYVEKAKGDDKFRHQMLALIVRPGEPIETIWSVPARARNAIARLGQFERGEFAERLKAIASMGSLRKQPWPRGRPKHCA
jgi:hypothetical protein